MQFEKLTKDFFRQLGQRMNDKVRFFAWRRGNMLVAFSRCMVQGDSLYAEYVGFDYTVALDLHLYHYIVRDMISWGIGKGYKWFRSSGLNYDPKLHMRHRLDPVDLYVRHTSLQMEYSGLRCLDRAGALRRDTEAIPGLQGPLVTILLPAIEFRIFL
jgi:predicted N-acyltransferase